MEIEELIPSYSHINGLYRELKNGAFGQDGMNELNAFYSACSDSREIERAIINALGNARFEILLRRLMNEAAENLDFYTRLGDRLEEFLTFRSENVLESRLLEQEIEEQTEKVNSIYDELKDLNHRLDWSDHDDIGQTRLRHERLDREHKEKQARLAELYGEKKQLQKNISGFLHSFPGMKDVDESVIALAKKYLPGENNKDVLENEKEPGTKSREYSEPLSEEESTDYKPRTAGLTLLQNLRPAQSNTNVIAAIVDILDSFKNTEAERTTVGYCIIALKELGITQTMSDKVLISAFKSDFFPDDAPDSFKRSIQRVLRSHANKGNDFIKDKSERWGDDKERLLQEIKVRLHISLGRTQ